MKLLRIAFVPLALSLGQAATAATFSYSGLGSVSSTGYSSTVGGITATVTASGNKLGYYALAPGLGNTGCYAFVCTPGVQNTESVTVSFSKSVTVSSLKINAWDSADTINVSASNGSTYTLSNGSLISSIGDFDLSGLGGLTSLTLTGASLTTLFSLNGLTVSSVPVPAAAWLFGSGLLGLSGFARRRKRAA